MADINDGARAAWPEWAISRLQSLPAPLFKQSVLHFLGNGGVSQFAYFIWCHEDKGPLQVCSQTTLRRYLTALKMRIKEWRQSPTLGMAPSWLRNVLDVVKTDGDDSVRIGKYQFDEATVLAAIAKHKDALTTLKLSALLLMKEHKKLSSIEFSHGVFLSSRRENIRLVVQIAQQTQKLEILEAFPRLKFQEGRRLLRDATKL